MSVVRKWRIVCYLHQRLRYGKCVTTFYLTNWLKGYLKIKAGILSPVLWKRKHQDQQNFVLIRQKKTEKIREGREEIIDRQTV